MPFLNRTGTMRSIARAAFGCPLLLTESIWEHSRPVEKRWQPRVVPHNGKWAVRGEGNSRVTRTYETQRQAQSAARSIAKREKSEVVIHRPNGQIRDKDSYGNDPFPPRG